MLQFQHSFETLTNISFIYSFHPFWTFLQISLLLQYTVYSTHLFLILSTDLIQWMKLLYKLAPHLYNYNYVLNILKKVYIAKNCFEILKKLKALQWVYKVAYKLTGIKFCIKKWLNFKWHTSKLGRQAAYFLFCENFSLFFSFLVVRPKTKMSQ